jgi:Cu/Ag efflux protein CusF
MRLVYSVVIVILMLFSNAVCTWASSEDVYTFSVKGVVKALPGKGLAANEILVRHEPIPEYRDESGSVVGMMAMTMPFYLDDLALIKDISVGDPIEMVVEQRIKPRYIDKVVSLTKLPEKK